MRRVPAVNSAEEIPISTNRTEENRISGFTRFEGAFRKRILEMIVSDAAYIRPFFFSCKTKFICHRIENADSFLHHFRTDSVARENGNFIILAHKNLVNLDENKCNKSKRCKIFSH